VRRVARDQRLDGVQGRLALAAQAVGVEPLVPDQHQHRAVTDRVDRHRAAAAAGHGLAQRALADLGGHPLRDRQPGSGERGQVVRVNAAGVLPHDQPVQAGHGGASDPGHLFP